MELRMVGPNALLTIFPPFSGPGAHDEPRSDTGPSWYEDLASSSTQNVAWKKPWGAMGGWEIAWLENVGNPTRNIV